ncbi:MAG TPA: DUF1232 domain-containing protein [Phycisphaeraceae bacterium]
MPRRVSRWSLLARLKAFWFLYKDPRTPWWAKLILTALAAAYAIWPMDLVPDWIPLAGVIDDLIVIPLLLWLITRAAPRIVRSQSRQRAGLDE